MSSKAPKWFDLINGILATIGTGEFKPLDDQKTYHVMRRVIDGLMSAKGIDGSVLHGFITNIRARIGPRDFTVEGPVYLTRNQQTHARAKGWNQLPSLDHLRKRQGTTDDSAIRMECGLDADRSRMENDLVEAYPLLIRILSASDPQAIRERSAKMPRKLAEELEFWWLNEMKRNEMNHEPDMIAASPQFPDEARTPWVISPDVHDGTEPPPMPEHEGEKVVQSKGTGGTRAQVSIWIKETKGKMTATGNLDVGSDKFRLVFGDYDWTMERLMGDGFDNDAYRKMLNDEVYPAYRSAQGVRDHAGMFQMSAVYGHEDSYARKAPVASEMCVALEWSPDGQLIGAVIIEGHGARHAELRKYPNGLYKGTF